MLCPALCENSFCKFFVEKRCKIFIFSIRLCSPFDSTGPTILALINNSLASGCIPAAFKHVVLQSLIKKKNLDPADLSNYRPISKLSFLSKVLEKVVLNQIN